MSNKKKKGNELKEAREMILDIFSNNKDVFHMAMYNAFRQNPCGYYKNFIQPFMPKEMKVETEIVNHSSVLKQLEQLRKENKKNK